MKPRGTVKSNGIVGSFAAAVIAVALVGFTLAGSAHAEDEITNVAPLAEPTASYTAGWNGLAPLNDNVTAYDGHGTMWGTCCVYPATEWTKYTWEYPVTISKSAFWFWNDMDGSANVELPATWRLEYLDPVTDAFVAVPGVTDYPINRVGESQVEFTAVTTTELRASFTASRRSNDSGYLAMGATEWMAWGTGGAEPVIPVDPNGPIDIAEVHIPTQVGVVPSLPTTVSAQYVDGRVIAAPVTWDAITSEMVATVRTFEVAGTATGIVEPVEATVYVRDGDPGDPVWVDYVSTITLAGVAPILPTVVTVEFEDGSRDSRIGVVWDPIDPAEYANDDVFFTVSGAVTGTDLVATATVWVEAPEDGEDINPPVIDLSVEPDVALSGWYMEAPTVTATARDNQDPDPVLTVSIDDGASVPYTGPILIAGEGEHTVAITAADESGNTSRQVLTVSVDTIAPTTVAEVTATTDESAEVTLNATDGAVGSGVERVLWATGPSLGSVTMWATYVAGEPFNITREADETFVWFYSQDVAGHQEVTKSLSIPANEEATTPTVSMEVSAAPNPAGWHNQPVDVVVTATDPGDPTPIIEVSIGDEAFVPYTGPITVIDDGDTTISARATNAAGKVSSIETVVVKLDATSPVVSAESDDDARTVTLSADDATSGIAVIEYRLAPATAWVEFAGVVTIGADGVVVEYRAVDNAGNYSDIGSVEFKDVGIDPTPTPTGPTTGPTVTPPVDGPRLMVSANQVNAGSTLTVTGTGFKAGASLELWLHSVPVQLTTVTVGTDGTISQVVTIPKATAPGAHSLRALNVATGEAVWSAPFAVGEPGGIEVTGAATAGVFTLAAIVLLAGVALVRRTRAAR